MSRPSLCAPVSLRDHLNGLLSHGACLVLPGPTMPVPIPLNECIILGGHRLLWATNHTPYGPVRPCVGQLDFSFWRPSDGDRPGCEFLDPHGQLIGSILPHTTLKLSSGRAGQLRREQDRHQRRAATDASYAHRWAQRFQEASRILRFPDSPDP